MKKWINSIGRYALISLLIVLVIGTNCEMEDVLPLFAYAREEKVIDTRSFFAQAILNELPLVVHAVETSDKNPWAEDFESAEVLGEENIPEEPVDLLKEMLQENNLPDTVSDEELQEGLLAENNAEKVAENSDIPDLGIESAAGLFVKNEKIGNVDVNALLDYQTLISAFYTIDSGTSVGSKQLNAEKFLAKDLRISKDGEGPQILIYHTHSLEAFADSVIGDRSQTIVGAGEWLAEILTSQYGYRVLHHTEEYDTDRNDAYANSLPGIQKVLDENPSIEVIIDLHRDAGVTNLRRAITLNGKPTATFMFFNGLSRTKRTGDIDYLYNPNLEDNLAFSFQMQKKAAEYYPGITRKIYLKAYRYNMHLKPRTLLIELGDSNSTVEEIMNACEPLAHILDLVLSGEE